MRVPEPLADTIRSLHGLRGRRWLADLPRTLQDIEDRWTLQLGDPFPNPSYNLVVAARTLDGEQAVLKLGVPNPELTREADALEAFAGRGAVRLLARATDEGALLLERAVPGRPALDTPDDDSAVRAVIDVMRELHRPAPPAGAFFTVPGWFQGLRRLRAEFDGHTGPFPAELVSRAESISSDLMASAGKSHLLHGDLHFDNVVSSSPKPWIAIDPKGVLGEPAYDAGAVFRNPLPGLLDSPDPRGILRRRLEVCCEATGLPRERLAGWAFSQAVLAGWWSYEDFGDGWQPFLRCAELLRDLR